jgi:hypothetical protein
MSRPTYIVQENLFVPPFLTNRHALLVNAGLSFAASDNSFCNWLKHLSKLQPLLVDELGYLTLKTEQVNVFFRLIDQRDGRVSTIITTNLDFPEWYDLFQNKALVDALLDRLKHHCITIRIDGPSLRNPEPQDTATQAAPASRRRTAAKAETAATATGCAKNAAPG